MCLSQQLTRTFGCDTAILSGVLCTMKSFTSKYLRETFIQTHNLHFYHHLVDLNSSKTLEESLVMN